MKFSIQPPSEFKTPKSIWEWCNQILLHKIRQFIDGAGLGFGDGTDADNIYGVWASYTTNGVANTQDAVTHNLGVVPVGFLVFSLDKGAVLYQSGTPWTSTQIFLKCTVATTAALIFIVGPSNQAY